MSSIYLGLRPDATKEERIELKPPADEGFQLTVIGSSGSGKTNTLYRIVEHLPKDRALFIADVEGDFVPLRAHRDFVIVGRGRDIPADPEAAQLLAKRFLELRFNIIFDAFEEKKKDRELFLKNFLETLHDAPRKLWNPTTLLLDEVDVWAPEKGEGEALSTQACAQAARRFRKRHFDIIMATTRVSAVDKTTISQSRNLLIGLANIDTDVKRSISLLGFTEKEERAAYRDLQRGEFYARGPELGLRRPEKILVGRADLYKKEKTHGSELKAPAPHGLAKELLQKELKDLQKEAAIEIEDREAMAQRIRELEAKLIDAQANPPEDTEQRSRELERAAVRGRDEVAKAATLIFQSLEREIKTSLSTAELRLRELSYSVPAEGYRIPPLVAVEKVIIPDSASISVDFEHAVPGRIQKIENRALGQGERLILKFLALRAGKKFSKTQVGAITGYSASGGSFNTYLSRLKTAGLVRIEGGLLSVADQRAAAAALGAEYRKPERAGLEEWLERLGNGGERKIYEVLFRDKGREFSREQLARAVGMQPGGGSFNTYISRLSTLGLLERIGGGVRFNRELLNL